eukprot:TRINITY_DN18701_c0_g1_i1.p1 TRINITY_DN18701_c0_g1~~TRINITY_DN18701_c0_g1_i1.p1  ORF type:complete len:732 (-),score=164.64 TRINITY_DN18701_c0_g1_i1:319-2220(-)
MDDYCSQVPVRHLVFMVHGIGQRLEKANLVDDVANFRDIVARLAELHLTTYQRNSQRVLFIPCQWRRSLKLQGEAMVEKITLEGVRNLRTMLSATAHDVLYYMSPIYCQQIIDSVSHQLNSLYRKFLKRNPGYDGKVSIYGHSLGSVLSYDILCHQHELSSLFPIENIQQGSARMSDTSENGGDSGNIVFTSDAISQQAEREYTGQDADDKTHAIPKQTTDCSFSQKESTLSDCGLETRNVKEDILGKLQQLQILTEEEYPELRQEGSDKCNVDSSSRAGAASINDGKDDSCQVPSETCDEDMDSVSVKGSASLRQEIKYLKEKIAELESKWKEEQSKSGSLSTSSEHGNRMEPGKYYTPHIHYTKLDFKVDTFFAVGSPLGVFLSLRNVRIGEGKGFEYWQEEGIKEEMPCCRQMMNIFHPYDPVAYRLEPLVCKEYVNKRPVYIPYHKGGKRLHIGIQDFGENVSKHSKKFIKTLQSAGTQMVHALGVKVPRSTDEEEDGKSPPVKTYGALMMEQLTGSSEGRIDYMLQDSTFEHAYLAAISSHTSYWRDLDTALFILNHLYCEIPRETLEQGFCNPVVAEEIANFEASASSSRDLLDEDTPLTFYGQATAKALSSLTRTPKEYQKAHKSY